MDYEEFVKGNNINFPEFDVLSTYGVADKDFSAMAMLVKLRISWDSHMFRENCIIADTLRDIGLTTPEDIERFDNIAYGDEFA